MAIIDKKGALHGSVSNIVYRTYRGQQIAQIKPARVKQTLNSKEAGLEFGLCSSTARAIRAAFAPVCKGHDGGMGNRLTGAVRKSVSACKSKPRGERDLHDADLDYLKGFQFNINSPVVDVFKVRPEAVLQDGVLKVRLPEFAWSDIKGLKEAGHYLIRLLAISFDFKKKLYGYHSCKEIVLNYKPENKASELIFDDVFPPGRVVFLSMSIHAFERDGFGGIQIMNSKEWNPAELIGVWQMPDAVKEDSWLAKAIQENVKLRVPMYYTGNESLQKMAKLWEKHNKAKAAPQVQPPVSTGTDLDLPKGDRKFNE